MKSRVGLMALSIEAKMSPLPKEALHFIDDYAKRAEESLKKNGLDVIRVKEMIENPKISVGKIKYLMDSGIHCLIFMIGAWPLQSSPLILAVIIPLS